MKVLEKEEGSTLLKSLSKIQEKKPKELEDGEISTDHESSNPVHQSTTPLVHTSLDDEKSFTPPHFLLKRMQSATLKTESQSACDQKKDELKPKMLQKKKSVLDLPMPPITFDRPIHCYREISPLSPPKSPYTPELSIEQFKHRDTHFKEICKHLDSNPAVISPKEICSDSASQLTTSKRPRPTILNRRKSIQEFPDRDFNSFKIEEQVGEGTYGKVYKAVDLINNNLVAMKYVRMEKESEGFPITGLREIKILRELCHPNIVQLREVIHRYDHSKQKGTFLIFEYMNHDLLGLLNNEKMVFDEDAVYTIFRQILEGINFCHKQKFLHRDLKCSNILVNSKGEVKLADFGLGREWFAERPYTNKVISLWYRPIELLLGEEKYGPSIDIWSLGCILAELFQRRPLFVYTSEQAIIDAIFSLCGTPTKHSWPEIKLLPGYGILRPKFYRRRVHESFVGSIPALALNLLDKMLCLNPDKRITAEESLQSGWISFMDAKKVKPLQLPMGADCHEMNAKIRRK